MDKKRNKVPGSGRQQKYGEPSVNKNIKVPKSRVKEALKDVNEALDRYKDPEYNKPKN